MSLLQHSFRTLAIDRDFKERVREDILVRFLDGSIWQNHGKSHFGPLVISYAHYFIDRQESS